VLIQYWAGDNPLLIYAISEADTTLVVLSPDGLWYCDDDTDGHNPVLEFNFPLSGDYNIWVGTYSGNLENATLGISEIAVLPR
jgi:hypothetical protein